MITISTIAICIIVALAGWKLIELGNQFGAWIVRTYKRLFRYELPDIEDVKNSDLTEKPTS